MGPRRPSHTPALTEHEKKQKLETDAMFRLEHGEADRSTLKKALPTLSHIQEAQSAWKDDFALNSMLRKRFRVSGFQPRIGTTGRQGTWHRSHGKLRPGPALSPPHTSYRHVISSTESNFSTCIMKTSQRSWAAPSPAAILSS